MSKSNINQKKTTKAKQPVVMAKAKPVKRKISSTKATIKTKTKAKTKKRILIASGVNLDLLGTREVGVYGRQTLKDMQKFLSGELAAINARYPGRYTYELVFFQTNDEHKFLMELSNGYCGAVVNAGAWSHTSLALADRLAGLKMPYAVAHVSDVSKREVFRRTGFLDKHALTVISGHGIKSYWLALDALMSFLNSVS